MHRHWTTWLRTKVDEKAWIERQATLYSIDINLHHSSIEISMLVFLRYCMICSKHAPGEKVF